MFTFELSTNVICLNPHPSRHRATLQPNVPDPSSRHLKKVGTIFMGEVNVTMKWSNNIPFLCEYIEVKIRNKSPLHQLQV